MNKNKIKLFINKLLSKADLKVVSLRSSGPHDFTNKDSHPLSAQYQFNDNKLIMDIDLSKCRTNRWFSMSKNTLDPTIFAIKNSLKKDLKHKELYINILDILKKQKKLIFFTDAAKLLDINADHIGDIKNYPWWATVYPWENRTFKYNLDHHPYEVKNNRAKNGFKILSNNPNEIMKDDLKNSLSSHAKQYAQLTELIKKNGFKYGGEYGYVTVELFVMNNKFCWKIGGEGNHRAAAAAALGLKKIPALITKIIRLEELEYWPNVINGSFNKDQASKIFYNIFDAKPSKIFNDWIKLNSSI